MIVKLLAAVPVLCLGLMLASCGANFVADHWPHFAGGEPNGLPPRPGEPGYQEFIAHGQPNQNTGSVSGEAQPPSAGREPGPAAAAPQNSADPDPKTDRTGGQPGEGGLY